MQKIEWCPTGRWTAPVKINCMYGEGWGSEMKTGILKSEEAIAARGPGFDFDIGKPAEDIGSITVLNRCPS